MELKTKQGIVITDIEIPFWSLVSILVQVAIAAIPAIAITAFIIFGIAMMFGGVGALVSTVVPEPAPVVQAQPQPPSHPAPEPYATRKVTKRPPWFPPE